MGSAQSTNLGPAPPPQDGVHPALLKYDILTTIFNTFNPQDRSDRQACARAARVCRAWNEPASRAIWSRTRWQLQDLYNVLKGYTRPKADAFMSLVDSDWAMDLGPAARRSNPTLQESFLRCASRVRKLYVSQIAGPNKEEVRLLLCLLSWGNGTTFLSGLLSLSWIESPITDRLLLLLVPSCLEHLELIIDSATPAKQAGSLLTKLPHVAPVLRSMVIYVWNTDFTPYSLLGHVSLRHLSLNGNVSLTPEHLRGILSLPALTSLRTRIKDFDSCNGPVTAHYALQTLDCEGSYDDLTALENHLLAPGIYHLGLQVEAIEADYSPSAQLLLSQTLAASPLTSTLRSLLLSFRTFPPKPYYQPDDPGPPRPHVSLWADVLQPLSSTGAGRGRIELDALTVDLELEVPLTDDDVRRLARTWPSLRQLALVFRSSLIARSTPAPSARAFLDLARLCPALEQLTLDVDWTQKIPDTGEIERELARTQPVGGHGHPLRRLHYARLDAHYAERMAAFFDALFPRLDTRWGAETPLANLLMGTIERLQNARRRAEAEEAEGGS